MIDLRPPVVVLTLAALATGVLCGCVTSKKYRLVKALGTISDYAYPIQRKE